MKNFGKLIFIFFCLSIWSCENNSKSSVVKTSDNSKISERDFKKINEYLLLKKMDLCSFQKSLDSIKHKAILKAGRKFPEKLSKHAKFIERYIEQNRKQFLQDHKISDSIISSAYRLSKQHCK